jgi:conjugative relaxase-like TrwC/TraI family protein
MRVMSAGKGYQYLLKTVAAGDGDRSMATPLTRYYTQVGTPPGTWMGAGLASLGPDAPAAGDQVTELQLQHLIGQGQHPATGQTLGVRYYQPTPVATRIAIRIAKLDPALRGAAREEAIRQIDTEEHARPVRHPVAGFDYTFSVPKSVSVLWGLADAGTQALIVQAHHDTVADVISLMEREVAATRVGARGRDGNSVAQAQVAGFLVTAYDHYDSRAGDPQLHTHCVISNKVMTTSDGRWRSLDSRPMHAATVAMSEHYNALLADRLTRLFGVLWETRDRGRNRNPSWEIATVTEPLIREFSTRTGDIDSEKDRLIAAYIADHGHQPSAATILKLRQQATLATRPDKEIRSLAELTSQWRGRATQVLGEDPVPWAGEALAGSGHPILRSDDFPDNTVVALAQDVVAHVSQKRSTWRRWNLHAEASRQTMAWRFATTHDRETLITRIVETAQTASVRLTPPDMPVPASFQQADGTSVFRPPHLTVFSSQALLAAENRLLELSRTLTAPALRIDDIRKVTAQPNREGIMLSSDQAEALATIAASRRIIDVLVGPAGTGKTTALAALRTAWEITHGPGSVVGLAPSATAAAVLAQDLSIATENTAKWLTAHDLNGDTFTEGQLVIVDEASLAGTFTLDRITALAAQAGAKVLLVGDWAQLQAVDAAGAFNLLVSDRDDAPELADIHRFRASWEKVASLELRHGHPGAIDTYQAHGRITGGTQDAMTEQAYQAWSADIAAGKASLLIADAHDTVGDLNQRARHERIMNEHVDPTRDITLTDGTRASTGDLVITRHNDRRLTAGKTGWVRNGDRWTITHIHPDGAVTVRRAGYRHGARVILPADYAANHLDLGYAVTAYRAQGITVDTTHTLATPATTREDLYVAMTRGRETNKTYVATDHPDDTHTVPHPSDAETPTATAVLTGVLRNTGGELSAHQMIDAEGEQWGNIGQLAAEFETIATAAQRDRWVHLIRNSGLTDDQADQVTASVAFGPLCTELRTAEANGHDPANILSSAIGARPLDDAADTAAVLHHRVEALTAHMPARSTRHRARTLILGFIPDATGEIAPDMRQTLDQYRDAMIQRARHLVQDAIEGHAPWLAALGERPTNRAAASSWDAARLALAAYRDRYGITDVLTFTPGQTPGRQENDYALVNDLIRRVARGIHAEDTPRAPSPNSRRSPSAIAQPPIA